MVGVGIVSLGVVADGVVKKGTIDWDKVNEISKILKVSARAAQGDSEENHHLKTVDRALPGADPGAGAVLTPPGFVFGCSKDHARS